MTSTRRVFLRAAEVPALIAGVLRGDAVAMRRVLGARKAGRVAVALGVVGLLFAVPWPAAAWLIGVQVVLGFAGGRVGKPALGWLAYQRLLLWLAGPLLIAAALLRLLWPDEAAVTALVAVVGANLWLARNLRRGLG